MRVSGVSWDLPESPSFNLTVSVNLIGYLTVFHDLWYFFGGVFKSILNLEGLKTNPSKDLT